MLHLLHAAQQGHPKAYIRIQDTDVVVLALSHFSQLNLTELWIDLWIGTGIAFKEFPIHHISQELGSQCCKALPFFHAFTGCHVTSALFGNGEKRMEYMEIIP